MESAEKLFDQIVQAGLLIDNNWKRKQGNDLDNKTKFIYSCNNLADLTFNFSQFNLNDEERTYAIHRWRNFKRHEAWLSLLSESVDTFELESNQFNRTRDFSILVRGTRNFFDLKVTRFPNSISTDLSDFELANWFYTNQSSQGRQHFENRFFVVGEPESSLYELDLAKKTLVNFSEDIPKHCHSLTHQSGSTSTAVILRHA